LFHHSIKWDIILPSKYYGILKVSKYAFYQLFLKENIFCN